MIRAFLPVGQGAFYFETHTIKDKEFTLVYDCGSSKPRGKRLERQIKATFPRDATIDALFISHFHADHINGIKTLKDHCRIRRVFCPLVDQTSRSMLKIANFIDNRSDYEATEPLIDNPQTFFGEDTVVIQIEEEDPNEERAAEPENPTDIETFNSRLCKSGKTFHVGLGYDWVLLPFNYKQEARRKQFEEELKRQGLDLDNFKGLEEIEKNKKTIKAAYGKIEGDLNGNSLVLFSGPSSTTHQLQATYRHCGCLLLKQTTLLGCLFTGDVDSKEPGLVDSLTTRLGRLKSTIGTLQVPHHGSIQSFDRHIMTINQIKIAVLSYGTANTYGHPSPNVIAEILSQQVTPLLVSEDIHSTAVQFYL